MNRSLPLLSLLALLAASLPLAADPGRFPLDGGDWGRDRPGLLPGLPPGTGLTHSFEGRFGVAHIRDSEGRSETIPMVGMRYTATWRHELDNGWRVGVAVGVEAANYGGYGRR